MTPQIFQALVGLLALTPVEVGALSRAAAAVPDLFAIEQHQVHELCQLLAGRAPAIAASTVPALEETAPAPAEEKPARTITWELGGPPAFTPEPGTPEADADALDEQALAVAQADPTQTTPLSGWLITRCLCGKSFQFPPTTGKLPSRCYPCLGRGAQEKRLERIRQALR